MLDIEVKHRLGNFTIDAKFEAKDTGLVSLFGQSGSGKSSIMNMIAGLLKPQSGRIEIKGRVLFDSHKKINIKPQDRKIGYVFQESRLFPHYTVKGNLLYGEKKNSSNKDKNYLSKIVEILGIEHILEHKPRTLSGGERQRVALGRALLSNPEILLMDEPLASLDETRKFEIIPLIETIRDEFNTPIVYVSHAINEIIRLADFLVLIDNGRIKGTGTIEEISGRRDLHTLLNYHEMGTVIKAKVKHHDPEYSISTLSFPGGKLRVPKTGAAVGETVSVRIRARDISLSLIKPKKVSQLNILEGIINKIDQKKNLVNHKLNHETDVCIDIGLPLWARITRFSIKKLNLQEGQKVYALIKSTSIDRESIGKKFSKKI